MQKNLHGDFSTGASGSEGRWCKDDAALPPDVRKVSDFPDSSTLLQEAAPSLREA